MALTLAQKSNVRRHLGYPVIGLMTVSPAGGTFAQGMNGWRFFQASGQLEFRMNNLAPDEEARTTGGAYGAIALVGPMPNAGDTISVTLSGGPIASPQTLTATAGAPSANDGRLAMLAALAQACTVNPVLQAAQVRAVQPYGTGAFPQNAVPLPEMAFICASSFTLAASGTGSQYPSITATGALLGPSASLDGGTTTIFGYLPILDGLEGAYVGASDNLDTIAADVWKGRSNELGQRMSLYRTWRNMFAEFLYVPAFDKTNRRDPSRTGAIRYA